MFDFNACNHMARFILTNDGIEDPGSHHSWSRLRWNIYDLYWHIDQLCMSHGYGCIWFFLIHRSTVYSWWLCNIFWWHGSMVYYWWPWLTFMNLIICSLNMGIPTLGMVSYYPDACLFAGSRLVCPLFPTHTHILKSISVVTSSDLILWGEFCYTLFWSP